MKQVQNTIIFDSSDLVEGAVEPYGASSFKGSIDVVNRAANVMYIDIYNNIRLLKIKRIANFKKLNDWVFNV